MSTPRLEPFVTTHASDVVALIRGVFVEYGMTFDLAHFDADLADVPAHYAARGGTFSVLVDGPSVVGTVAAVPKSATACEIKRLYLSAGLRGRGHGRRLLEHVLAWATARGYRHAVAWSDVRLRTAHQVYERLGFTRTGERVCDDIDRSREYGFTLTLAP